VMTWCGDSCSMAFNRKNSEKPGIMHWLSLIRIRQHHDKVEGDRNLALGSILLRSPAPCLQPRLTLNRFCLNYPVRS
jgi:hypothetical protein